MGAALAVAAIPDIDLALGGAVLTFLAAWIVSTITTTKAWPRLHMSLRLIQIGVSLSVLATVVRLVEAVLNGGVLKELSWADAIAGPALVAIAAGMWLAARARAAMAHLSDILDAAAFSIIPLGVFAAVVANELFGGRMAWLDQVTWILFFGIDAFLLTMVVLMIFGPGVRSAPAVWIGTAGLAVLVYDLLVGIGSILDTSWQDTPSRALAFAITGYAIATTFPDYPDIASPGTRQQRYRSGIYVVGSAGILALNIAGASLSGPSRISLIVTTGVFLALMAARMAHAALTSQRLQTISNMQAELAQKLTHADTEDAALAAATSACRQLLGRDAVLVTVAENNEPVVVQANRVRITSWLTIAPHLVVAYSQIAHVVDIALDAIEVRVQRAAEAAQQAAIEATTDAATGWRTQSELIDRSEPIVGTLAIVACPGIVALSRSSGKQAGDQVAREIALRLTRFQERADEGGTGQWRGDGPNFIIAFGRQPDLEHLLMDLQRPGYVVDGDNGTPTFMIGAVELDTESSSTEALGRARMALDEAQPGTVEWWSEEMDEAASRRWAIATAFRRSLADPGGSGFCVHYQGIVDAQTEAPVAVEALARWIHPKLGPISPGEFIPIAEEEGLVDALDRWVMDTALRDLDAMRAVIPHLKIHVNASPVGPLATKLESLVHTIRLQHSEQADALVVELTETSIDNHDGDDLAKTCRLLRQTGVGLALDDFGTGQSNLARLAQFPFTEIKLARDFVVSANSQQMLATMVPAIKNLGLPIIAENVETREQVEAVRAVGVDWIQGWYYSKAQPLHELVAWLGDTRNDLGSAKATEDSLDLTT